MTTQQLYIDGQLADIDEGTKITLDIKSNLFQDISKIVSNTTFSIKLPKTVHNQLLIGHTDKVRSGSEYPYELHTCRYFRDGVEIIHNGKAVLLSIGDDIEISVIWGLFPTFSALVSAGTALNQLDSDARILWSGNDSADTYANAQTKDYFFAGMNIWTTDEISEYWNTSNTKNAAQSGFSRGNGSQGYGGRFGGNAANRNKNSYLHPSVKVSWVLALIKKDTGVDFKFTGDAKTFIDTLIIPLINKKANSLTFNETFSATLPAISGTTMGALEPTIKTSSNIFKETSGTVNQLTAIADCKVYVNIQCIAEYNLKNWRHGTKGWLFDGVFVVMTLTKTDGTIIRYTAGDNRGGSRGGFRSANLTDYPSGIFTDYLEGTGIITMEKGDMLTFATRYCCYLGFGNGSQDDYYKATTPQSNNPPTTFKGGTVEISATGNDDNVPVGGYFPIAYNLPQIKITDFVKFLAAITGTFPRQMNEDGVVEFVPFNTLWDNLPNAVDWSNRLIPLDCSNRPRNMEYKLSDYAQHNYYKWKEDDTVIGTYDGDLQVANANLDASRDVMTFPFAATDGSYVPLYTKKNDTTSTDSDGNTTTTENAPTYKACKDRILQLVDDGNGKAAGQFNIDMQQILDTSYHALTLTLQNIRVLKEKVILSDIDIMNFDETKPVYFKQYASYFAVTEIRAEQNGLAEVTMLLLNASDV